MNWTVLLLNSFRFLIKGGLAGAAVYVAYDQGLLGGGKEGAEAFRKAQETLPPAIQEWTNYLGWEVRAAQVTPATQTPPLKEEQKTLEWYSDSSEAGRSFTVETEFHVANILKRIEMEGK